MKREQKKLDSQLTEVKSPDIVGKVSLRFPADQDHLRVHADS